MRRRHVIALLVIALLVGLLAPGSAAASPALPNSMAALGDSITRAYDVCCSYSDHPGQSWSTGGAWYDGISSHYERIRRRTARLPVTPTTMPSPEPRWPRPRLRPAPR